MKLEPYNPEWGELYAKESAVLKNALKDEVLAIEHIGSTAIKGILSKPIIDIAILVAPINNKAAMAELVSPLGYYYDVGRSSVERMFFTKGNPVKFHLSITEKDITPYWERQILFRDYLNANPKKAKEYEALKQELINRDPSAGPQYSSGKDVFVREILKSDH